MSTVVIVGILTARPGSEEIVAAALTKILGPTRAEDGCLDYQLYVTRSDATTFVTVERWRDEAAIDAHLKSEHVKQSIREAGRHVAGAPIVHRLTAVG